MAILDHLPIGAMKYGAGSGCFGLSWINGVWPRGSSKLFRFLANKAWK